MHDADFSGDRLHSPARLLGTGTWATIHRLLTLVLCATALFAVFPGDGDLPLKAGLYTAACAAGLLFSRGLHLPLLDLFGQLQYRERLLVFVIHLAVFCAPVIFGYGDMTDGFAGVLALLTFQAIQAVHYGRIYACSAMLIAINAMWLPLPPFLAVTAWMLALLAAVRVEHVRFRLEAHGSGSGLPIRDFLGESIPTVVLPWGIGTTIYAVTSAAFAGQTRELNLDGTSPGRTGEIGPIGISSVLIDAAILIAIIIGTLVTLHWLERKFRRRRPGETMPEEEIGSASERRDLRGETGPAPVEIDEGATPRGRILARFRTFLGSMARLNHERGESETAREYLGRLAGHLTNGRHEDAPSLTPFHRACYSIHEPSEEEALAFIHAMDELEPSLRDAFAREAAREETPDDDAPPPPEDTDLR